MAEADRERWEARWAARGGEEPPGAPEPYLVRNAGALPPGPTMDAACGDGRNALWLAATRGAATRGAATRGGGTVTAVDVAPSAVARLRAAAGAAGLAVEASVADLDDPEALSELGPFAAVVVVRYKPSAAQWGRLLDRLEG